MVKPSDDAIERRPEMRNSRPMMTTAIQTLTTGGIVGHQRHQRAGHHDLVGDGVQQHAHGGDLAALAGQVAVQAIGNRGQHKQHRRRNLLLAVRPAMESAATVSTAAAGS